MLCMSKLQQQITWQKLQNGSSITWQKLQNAKLVTNCPRQPKSKSTIKCTTTKKYMSKRYMKCQYQLSLLITASMEVQVISQDTNRSGLSILWYVTILYSLYLLQDGTPKNKQKKNVENMNSLTIWSHEPGWEFYIICVVSSTTRHGYWTGQNKNQKLCMHVLISPDPLSSV